MGPPQKRNALQRAYPSTIAVFSIDGSTRMVVYADLGKEWSAQGTGIGLSIASNIDQFPGRSTVSPVWPQAAGNGFLYAVGDHEVLPGGDVGNPVILRYRFTPCTPLEADQ